MWFILKDVMRDYVITSLSMTPLHMHLLFTHPLAWLNCFLSRNYDSEKLVVLVYIIYLDIVPSIRTWKFGNILRFTAQVFIVIAIVLIKMKRRRRRRSRN